MRVLWLCSTPALGAELLGAPAAEGAGWVASLEAAVGRQGEVELSIGFPWDVLRVKRLKGDKHEYLPFPCYPRGSRFRRLLADVSCRLEPRSDLRHLQRVVEMSRPDLIHVWGTEAFYGLVAEHCDVPVLVGIQGLRTACTEVYFGDVTKLDLLRFGDPKRLLNGRSLLHRFYRYRRSAVREREILAQTRYVSGRTDWDRSATASLAPVARYFHCDEILRPPFYRGEWRRREPEGPVRLVSTLRGNAYKGIETLALCAGLLQEMIPAGVEWSVVGLRPGEEIHRIVERKLSLSFEKQGIRLLGRQPAAEVARRLLDSDIFVHTSRIDNSPNSLCEAMMLGLPIVSTNVGGIPSLVEHGKEGLLVPPGDPQSMAEAIRQASVEAGLALRLAVEARRRARARHEPAAVVGSLRDAYLKILSLRSEPGE